MSEPSKYNLRGVSSKKEDVYQAISGLDPGLFPKAFCKVFPDFMGNDETYCALVHADGAGTKSALAYLYWKETGDLTVWRGIAQDSLVMNLDDLICTGAVDHFLFCSIINRNKQLISAEVLTEIIQGTNEFIEKMDGFGIHIHYMGGETADLGDVVRTITVDSTITCRIPRNRVIKNEIRAGDVIVGFASSGQTTYEETYNSGIGSNGLTSARHDVLDHSYLDLYPETADPEMKVSLAYSGTRNVNDPVNGTPLNTGKLLLSPTRTYAPLMKVLLQNFFDQIHGAVHCSGGGQTKVLHFVENLHVIKDNLFPVPPVFKLIREESRTEWKEMYQVFNMGHRLELYCDPTVAEDLIAAAAAFHMDARMIGRVEAAPSRRLSLVTAGGTHDY